MRSAACKEENSHDAGKGQGMEYHAALRSYLTPRTAEQTKGKKMNMLIITEEGRPLKSCQEKG